MPIQEPLKSGAKGIEVKNIQEQLLALGYALPRFGVDSDLGDETLAAFGAFLVTVGLREPGDEIPDSITVADAAALDKAYQALQQQVPTAGIIDERAKHPHSGRSVSMPYRTWSNVTAIVLHQTATKMGEKASAWHRVPIHFGVTRAGKIYQLYELTEVCNHAGNFNRSSVGIEIDGWFSGIEGQFDTLWQPGGPGPKRQPMDLPAVQAEAVKTAVRWIVDAVAANGGKITHIHPHRQASSARQSDPGSLIWKTVGLWAKMTFNLDDGGKNFTVGDGLKIPEAWDSQYVGNKY
ncbi:N-acetylmuramoyl-L-alanine amidase [Variovorax sp. efr-133-TYG-130]|uniref:peptidoglycan recognition protein family protein n=1 Tax=Variovorax sp. efr-133-TYG-130 TaxID=3040327 RepID=UPI0025552B92|nr:N-acetylmuramoyl-L-alanine amidase [Variovorax sp. efr-133-TYG-130]